MLFNQLVGVVDQIFVMRGDPYINLMLQHEIEQEEVIVPDLLIPLVGHGLGFDVDPFAQPEVEGCVGGVQVHQRFQVGERPPHISLDHQTHIARKLRLKPAVKRYLHVHTL